MLEALKAGDAPSQGFLFFGPRGNGKTTLLAQIAEDARRRGMRAEKLAASAFGSRERLTRQLQEKANLLGARITGAQAAGFGVSAHPGQPVEDIGELLRTWIGVETTPLVILLDEAQTIGADAGRDFFDAVQDATERELGFLAARGRDPRRPSPHPPGGNLHREDVRTGPRGPSAARRHYPGA